MTNDWLDLEDDLEKLANGVEAIYMAVTGYTLERKPLAWLASHVSGMARAAKQNCRDLRAKDNQATKEQAPATSA